MFCCSTAFAKQKKALPDLTEVVPLFGLNTPWVSEFVRGQHPEVAIECPAGVEIPLRLLQTNKYFQVGFAPNLSVKLQKTVFVRVVRNRAYISFDLEKWTRAKHFLEEALDGTANAQVKTNPADNSILVEVDWKPEEEN